ncbi:indolethylamine N-methyltransferase-like [Ornithodoros turicata]|uniref:indolethylamine N-methyltransferase-like n=1 Tax=Ornithodoros turicata TaxID=34597 RepID=UPI0031389574
MDYNKLKEQYQSEFDPADYPEMVKTLDFLYLFYQCQLHEIVSSGALKDGGTFLDFGCGPTPFSVYTVAKKFHEVAMCEFLEQNRRALQKWVDKDADALDWSFLAESQAKLEGYSDIKAGASEVEDRTRKAIKHIIPCDAFDMSAMPEEHRVPYDVLFTCLCFESAAVDLDGYNKVVSNVAELIKPGGDIVQCGVLGCNGYTVGKTVFDAMRLTEDIVKTALKTVGFEINRWQVDEPRTVQGYDYKYEGAFVVMATKA